MDKELEEYIASIEKPSKREDTLKLVKIMEEESGYKAALRDKTVGFGMYHYQYASGHQGDAIVTGFAPRKQNITIYIMPGFSRYESELEKLGKFKVTKSCLYINKLSDVDEITLRRIIRSSVKRMKEIYHCRDK